MKTLYPLHRSFGEAENGFQVAKNLSKPGMAPSGDSHYLFFTVIIADEI